MLYIFLIPGWVIDTISNEANRYAIDVKERNAKIGSFIDWIAGSLMRLNY